MATPGFGTDVCEITGGWESSDLHPGADQLPLPPQPLSRLLPEAPGQSQPPILPSHEPQGVGDLQRSQQKCPEDQGERTGASAGNTLTTTPDNPQLSMEQTEAEWNPRWAQLGVAMGVWDPRCRKRTQRQDIFWKPARQEFPNPWVEATLGEAQP